MMKQTNRIIAAVRKQGATALLLACVPLSLASCIDEDLSDCGVDFAVSYQLELSPSIQNELDNKLLTSEEQLLAEQIRNDLSPVLSDRAEMMDLSFFSERDENLVKNIREKPNSSQLSMTFYLKPDNYHNVALAVTDKEEVVRIHGSESYGSISLMHFDEDTVDAHSSAIYMGYKLLLLDERTHTFFVPLYMQNAVPVLVINRNNSPASLVSAYTRGTANAFLCADSVFIYEQPAVIRNSRADAGGLTAFYTVCFPSADTPQARAAADPAEAEASLWEMDVYTQLPDGKYVKNILYVKEPLKAGDMQVIKVKLTDEGELISDNPEVGVSVELDWKPGGDFDIEI